ncbi:nucleoside-diphosphate-sugar pyrophosphorylase [Candidatus Roizmanbacteria bacterium CG_4_9_14_0_2_um_filter_39_13]|uniref:Nucleoside-diphosphate-sugar pyrophosphorylase n=2 Tax=Candidatus Roizmaniibacteriota TaxID=1752723 RepID=A0A2M8EW75_9BACT|nr:MAG: nucleoside-diphosphate-sugar pyrophosphorylase [Candidatus Roizmanbacteria bacterium CG_4_10_14_0_2_um_filter_39_12]PJC30120.1 MAG: nucleoside-diphosphate-sugar pyrophosphorylase [Candidatus Roizmanbacteria bacterium CG_4_9_14_0_2_um_filter_39_13]PJE61583.1 MAG: nucleoside-diphosphate-sugar pyrophosphorylase [Candidatus Roizmanbacteria bacterium CG10_big_fil_rev_8_21_14_0_10_39_12]
MDVHMRRSRITITLETNLLKQVDQIIDKKRIRNRSHAIEYILSQHTQSKVHTAVILAGGRGTNLRPYTYEIPKPMLPVKGTPILEHLIYELKKNDVTDIIIAISYLGHKIKEYFGNGEKFGVNIQYSEEQENLLTGGALLKIKSKLQNDTFFVIHGDILTNMSFREFVQFHKNQGSVATVALATSDKPTEFGQIILQGTRLKKFYPNTEKSGMKSLLVHSGIYAFEPAIFKYFPKDKKRFALEDVIRNLIEDQNVSGFVFEGKWFDVGDPKDYERAIKEFKR